MKFGIFFCFFLLFSCTPCRVLMYNIPQVGDQHLFPKVVFPPSSHPRALPVRTDSIPSGFYSFLRSHRTLAFLLIRNDTVRLEYYAPHIRPDMTLDLFSISKSIVASVLALACEEGYIGSLSDPLENYFSDLPAGYSQITLNDLLDMRSGIKNSFWKTTQMYYSHNLDRTIRHIPLGLPPGRQYEYSNAATQWLVAIIEKATGKTFQDYFYEKIWRPLHLENEGSWSLDSRTHYKVRGFCGFNLSLRDLGRIGLCYLHGGEYGGDRIIPAGWLSCTFSPPPHSERTPDHFLYHKQWRIITPNEKLLAKGFLGQYLYLDKKHNTVIIRLGTAESSADWLSLFGQWAAKQYSTGDTGRPDTSFNTQNAPVRSNVVTKNN